jgi:hypothetical protein
MFGLDFIRALKPCKWRYTGDLDDGREHFGFIAQEVEAIASHDRYAFVQIRADGVYQIVLGEFIGPIVKAVQELDEKLNRLIAEKGQHDPIKLGDNQTGSGNTLGAGHDLAPDLGDMGRT